MKGGAALEADSSRSDDRPAPSRGRAGYPPAFVVFTLLLVAGVAASLPAGLRAAAERPWEALLWVAFIAAANILSVPILPRFRIDASLGAPVSVAAAVLLPPPLAIVVNAAGFLNLRELRGEAPLMMSVFNRGQMGLAAGAASVVAQNHPFAGQGLGATLFGTLLAVFVYSVVNSVSVSISLRLRGIAELRQAAQETTSPVPAFAVDFGFASLLSVLIVVSFEAVGLLAPLLLALPLWLGYSAIRSARIAEDRAEELAGQVVELQQLNTAAGELLTSRGAVHVSAIARRALRNALDTDRVEMALDGRLPDGLEPVKVPGAAAAVLGVPPGLGERTHEVVEAIAGLVGMTLTRQELEQELAEVQRARAALSAQIIEEGTRERSRMALQLHDDVLPGLAAAQIQADNVRSSLGSLDLERADKLATATRDAVQNSIGRLREVLEAIRRQIIVPGGLRPGLVEALEDLKLVHGVHGQLLVPEPMPEIPFAIEILFLDTVRGCLANVALHAKASSVQVELSTTDKTIVLEVRDDGSGFDTGIVPQGHHGLALMAQRVELARGRFTVNSAAGQGSQVRMEVPL